MKIESKANNGNKIPIFDHYDNYLDLQTSLDQECMNDNKQRLKQVKNLEELINFKVKTVP